MGEALNSKQSTANPENAVVNENTRRRPSYAEMSLEQARSALLGKEVRALDKDGNGLYAQVSDVYQNDNGKVRVKLQGHQEEDGQYVWGSDGPKDWPIKIFDRGTTSLGYSFAEPTTYKIEVGEGLLEPLKKKY